MLKGKHSNHHTFIHTYKRPESNKTFYKEHFFTALQTCIDEVYHATPSTTITIVGDLNINLLQPKQRLLDFLTHNDHIANKVQLVCRATYCLAH
eukprot:g29004.t1